MVNVNIDEELVIELGAGKARTGELVYSSLHHQILV